MRGGLVVGCVFWGFFQVFFCVFFPGGNEVSRNRELVRRPYLWTDSTLWVLGLSLIRLVLRLRREEGEISSVVMDIFLFVPTAVARRTAKT